MSIVSKSNVKSNFQTGDQPTQANFVDLIDSTTVPLVSVVGPVSSNVATDVSTADIFELTLVGNINLDMPTNGIDGKNVMWYLTQSNGGGNAITLDPSFVIPNSVTPPLSFSTVAGETDVFVAKYNNSSGKYLVVSMVPGYVL